MRPRGAPLLLLAARWLASAAGLADVAGRAQRIVALAYLALALLLIAGCDKVVAFGTGASLVEPESLRAAPSDTLVVDIRSRADYERGHIPGSVWAPSTELNGYFFRIRQRGDRAIVIVCESGVTAPLAVPVAQHEGLENSRALAGGIRRWRAEGLPIGPGPVTAEVESAQPPSRALTRPQQLLVFLTGGVIKPTYMLLTLVVVWALRRGRSPALRLLFHGALWFFVGEAFCAINYYVHRPGLVYPIDLLHGAGMVVMSALLPWGFFRLLDDRVVHFADPAHGCAVQRLCGRCWKRDPVRCGPHDVMILVVAGLAIASFMPWTSALRPELWVTHVFGSAVEYGAPTINHLVELRAYPLLGGVLFAITFVLLWGSPRAVRRSEPVFFAAFGFLAYSLLRHLLVNTYRGELWWSDFWEELTELLMIVLIGLTLIVFRRQLGLASDPEQRPAVALPVVDGRE